VQRVTGKATSTVHIVNIIYLLLAGLLMLLAYIVQAFHSLLLQVTGVRKNPRVGPECTRAAGTFVRYRQADVIVLSIGEETVTLVVIPILVFFGDPLPSHKCTVFLVFSPLHVMADS
jgi:hypothetical protein